MFIDLLDFNSEHNFSIAILLGRTKHGNHTGILTKLNEEIEFFHLAWHNRLCRQKWDSLISDNETYLIKKWVKFNFLTEDPRIAEFRIPSIIKRLQKVQEKNSTKIPYALNFKNTIFKDDDSISLAENEYGLTCSTFVSCFFNSVAIELVDLSLWEDRKSEDETWKDNVLDAMKKTGVSQNHINIIEKEKISYRLKPEEIAVASSCLEKDLPATFDFCSKTGASFNNI